MQNNSVNVVIGSWGSYNECNERALGSKWLDLSDYSDWEEIEEELVGSMIFNLEYACHEIWNYYNVLKNNTDGKD